MFGREVDPSLPLQGLLVRYAQALISQTVQRDLVRSAGRLLLTALYIMMKPMKYPTLLLRYLRTRE